jgi:polyribonucleotide nucleotidyltransferase
LSADSDIGLLQEDILSAMTKVEDSTYRLILSLMLRVISAQQKLLKEMVDRLDTVIDDEQRMREIVLNGHDMMHHKHHDWLEKQLANSDELEYAMRWAAGKMAEEKEQRSNFKRSRNSVVEKIFIAGITFIFGFHINKLMPYLFGG